MRKRMQVAALVAALVLAACSRTDKDTADQVLQKEVKATPVAWTTAVTPKPLSDEVKRGIDWIVKHQHENGGWAQGDESANMGRSMDAVKDRPNVADSCMALLTLVRAGSTPAEGPHRDAVKKGLDFICGEIEKAPAEGLTITSVNGTRVQAKIGRFVDTFLASMLLAELKDRTGSKEGDRQVLTALDKVMDKIEKNQQKDGTWDRQGWAPIISQSLAGKGINRAQQAGWAVDSTVLANAEKSAQLAMVGATSGPTGVSMDGAAGVPLYATASNLSILNDSMNSRMEAINTVAAQIDVERDVSIRGRLENELTRLKAGEETLAAAHESVVDRLKDPAFVSGFGSNGGEEFLSYMNIAESLVVKADDVWRKWDAAMTDNLNRIQNQDGSWSGHHCITGRTFCTAAALMTLMGDRTPVPPDAVAAK